MVSIKNEIYLILHRAKCFILYNYYVSRNKNLDYFEYKKLSVDFPIFSTSKESGIIGNKCYGNLRAVRNALGDNFEKNCMIEHGLYFGEYVIKNECQIEGLKTIYTYSEYRLKSLMKSGISELDNVNVVLLGPYIKYVRNFNSVDRFKSIKAKYGRILLVFPFHSSPEVDTFFNVNVFVNKIKELATDYDSVFVSMFWLDIVRDNFKPYSDAGFTIVSSGHRNDPFFLERQRDLIDLAEMTMSNDIGTHIGYCICLGKPHYIFSQDVIVNDVLSNPDDNFDDNYWKIYNKEREILYSAFSTFEPQVTEEQVKLVEYYWGKGIK